LDEIKVEVFNVTNITSGYLLKDLPIVKYAAAPTPISTVRVDADYWIQKTYSNTSQYLSFSMSKSEVNTKVKQYNGGDKIPLIK
jgi:hypothetical protein